MTYNVFGGTLNLALSIYLAHAFCRSHFSISHFPESRAKYVCDNLILQNRKTAFQGHSRSPISVQIDFLLVNNNNLYPISHHLRVIAE